MQNPTKTYLLVGCKLDLPVTFRQVALSGCTSVIDGHTDIQTEHVTVTSVAVGVYSVSQSEQILSVN